MVTVYLPRNRFPFGGIILLFAIAMVTLIGASALANDPYKFLRYEIIIISCCTYILIKLCCRNGLLYRNGISAKINNLQFSVWQIALTILIFVALVITFLFLLYFFYSVVG